MLNIPLFFPSDPLSIWQFSLRRLKILDCIKRLSSGFVMGDHRRHQQERRGQEESEAEVFIGEDTISSSETAQAHSGSIPPLKLQLL